MDFFKKRKQCSDDDLQKKIASLSPELQAQFLWATDVLLQKESSLFLEVIQDSRNEINDISQEIRNEKSMFRAGGGRLDKYNDTQISSARSANEKLTEFVEKRQKNKRNKNIPNQPEKEKEAVENYLKAVGRHKDNDPFTKNDIPSYARPATSGSNSSRPGTAFKIKMDVSPKNNVAETGIIPTDPNFNKQQEELIHRLKEQDSQAISERERQKKLLEKKKAERQSKTTDSAGVRAADMIDQSRGVDEKQLQNKLQQEKSILERLEKMKVNKNVSPVNERSLTMVASSGHESKNSLFEESTRNLAIRPQTGESKSPSKTPECIELRTPTKPGWGEIENQKHISDMFEINEQYPQSQNEEKKHKKKKHKKKHNTDQGPIENNNDIDVITLGD